MNTSIDSSHSTLPSKNLKQLMQKHPLFFFFLIAYLFSWIMLIPYILSQWGILHGDFRIFFVIKSFGLFLAAFIMTSITEGKEGVLRLWRSITQVRAGWLWYLLILVGIPSVIFLGMIFLPGVLQSFQGFPSNFAFVYLATFFILLIGGGPLGEEPGWRGFALPRMQPRYGPLGATLLLGVLWCFWHLPDFLTDAQRGGPGTNLTTLLTINLPIFFLLVMSLSVIFTWVFNHTRGSVFIAILLHTSINTFGIIVKLFSATREANNDWFMCIGLSFFALLILILTRGRLGYKPVEAGSLGSG